MDKEETLKDRMTNNIKDKTAVLFNGEQHNNIYRAVLLKTERLVSAIHLVTGLLDTKEKIRSELRSVSVDSINDLYFLEGSPAVKSMVSDKIFKKISHIVSLLEIGLTSGLISEMNYSILKEEYSKLKDILANFQLTNSIDSLILPEQFFGTDLNVLDKTDPLKGVFGGTKTSYIKDISKMSYIKRAGVTTSVQRIKPQGEKDKEIKDRTTDKSTRQELVLKVIRGGMEYTIKDIITEVSLLDNNVDCSDKTIQRDILSLVSSGTLIKSGERRWSRYSRKAVSGYSIS